MLKIATYNIHKGHSMLRGCSLAMLKAGLSELAADIVCLQEVQETSRRRAESVLAHGASQIAALQSDIYPHVAYGANAIYSHGHHGNAILSRYPIHTWQNIDVSDHRLEQRGLLHAVVEPPILGDVHVICAHFGLFKVSRVRQAAALAAHVERSVPDGVPLIVAGDFNDWNLHVHHLLTQRLHVVDAVEAVHQQHVARTFPARLPWFKLDRLYVRGVSVLDAQVHTGREWRNRSDHAPMTAVVR
ncbi:MAG: endonuclease/exonuclease/phosphatase family protein [Formosimonas sp.]